jgi:hypothetical protein
MNKSISSATATLILAVFLAGNVQAKPDEATEAAVQDCRYLTQVTGLSGYGKNSEWEALAKTSAERKAAVLGATHIVFTESRPVGAFNGEVTGKAYLCHH